MANLEALKLLRKPFEPHQISKKPQPYRKDSPKGTCKECGGYHGLPALHLDYVGHAALTDRLLDADPEWTWEPVALDPNGFPLLDKDGGMWIKLTVGGVTRLGYGNAPDNTGPNATKERIGDALRNAAMRFGAAIDLWHKGELHLTEREKEEQPGEDTPEDTQKSEAATYPPEKFDQNKAAWKALIESGQKTADGLIVKVSTKAPLSEKQKTEIRSWKITEGATQ